MTRENVDTKARRYLAEGRLTVMQLDALSIEAVCRGGGALYELGHTSGSGWFCSCPARGVRCAHLHALRLVTVRAGDVDADPEPAVTRPRSVAEAGGDGDDVEPVVHL